MHYIQQQGLHVDVIVTDRHGLINKWIRENHTHVKHF